MEFDDIKKQYKQVKAPGASLGRGLKDKNSKQHKQEDEMNQFLNRLKKRDRQHKRYLKPLYIIYSLMCLYYVVTLLFRTRANITGLERAGMVCIIACFLVGAVYFKRLYSGTRDAGYHLPTLEFLQRTEKRYAFKYRYQMAFLVPMFLLMDIGFFLALYNRVWGPETGIAAALLQYHLMSGLVLGLGFYGDVRLYRKKDAPILEQVRALKRDFLADNGGEVKV